MQPDGLYRKVLIIAYYFPPMGLSGVQRTAKFAKYLPKYGWNPTVLTVSPAGYYAFDDTLLAEVQQVGVEIVRTPSLDANRLFKRRKTVKMPSERLRKILQFCGDSVLIPDTKIGWKSGAVKAAAQLLEREQFDLLFATAPPQTDFLIGAALKKRFKLPLVVDYRDAWLDYPFKYFPTPAHRMVHKHLEKRVLKAADRVIVTHRRVKESLLRRYPTLNYHEVTILSQGYDPEDFGHDGQPRTGRTGRMRITHSGTFYADRSPRVLLRALASVLREYPKLRGRIELNLVGTVRDEDRAQVRKLNLQESVTFQGYLSHRESIQQLLTSDVLWFVLDNDFQTPGKLYEYFGARRPILASVVDGYTRQLIQESGASVCLPLKDQEAHRAAILDLFSRFEQQRLPQPHEGFAERFDRLRLTGELAKQFELLMDYERNALVLLREKSE